jgi:hypothetical protein
MVGCKWRSWSHVKKHERIALERAGQVEADARTAEAATELARKQAHAEASANLVQQAKMVAAELVRLGHPGIERITFWEDRSLFGIRDAFQKKRVRGGWSFYDLGNGGDNSDSSKLALLADGRLVFANGSADLELTSPRTQMNHPRIVAAQEALDRLRSRHRTM